MEILPANIQTPTFLPTAELPTPHPPPPPVVLGLYNAAAFEPTFNVDRGASLSTQEQQDLTKETAIQALKDSIQSINTQINRFLDKLDQVKSKNTLPLASDDGAIGVSNIKFPNPVKAGGPAPTSATSRASAIPKVTVGSQEQLTLAKGQTTYRKIEVSGGAGGTVVSLPKLPEGLNAEIYTVRDFQSRAHKTQVLEPVTSDIKVAAGDKVSFIVRLQPKQAGEYNVDIAGARFGVDVSQTAVNQLPMMAWINEADASKRGASAKDVSSVLSHFGVSASGNSGVTAVKGDAPSSMQFFSVAYDAAKRLSPQDAAKRVLEAEKKAKAVNPNAQFWVEVSDEQDQNAAQAQQTAAWIKQLRKHLDAAGSESKLFAAAQARPYNLVYTSVVDGWATTQSSVGQDRDSAVASIKRAAQSAGRDVKIMQYPGNAFLDGKTTGGAAISTASAAMDGAEGWFIYSSNNLDMLENGWGDEGKGDIGGFVAIDKGRVLPTIALIEAEMGASVGAAAKQVGATNTQNAMLLKANSKQLDSARAGSNAIDIRAWEKEIGQRLA